eukprot:COSAG01_NODE_27863_length_675_cov_0.689236_1_plen_192_part_10
MLLPFLLLVAAAAAAAAAAVATRRGGGGEAVGPAATESCAAHGSHSAQDAAYRWSSRGELAMALPCFHEALLKSAQHPWLWTDYARALQGVVRGGLVAAVAGRRQRQQQQPTDCPAAAVAEELAALQGWEQQLSEAEAAADVALMLGGGADDVSAAWRVRQRLGGTARRLGAAFQALAGRRCGGAGVAAAVL